MSGLATDLITEIECGVDDQAMAARHLRAAASEILDEVNRLEREYPEHFMDMQGREWHIARYEPEPQP